jgi:hypothetical protein
MKKLLKEHPVKRYARQMLREGEIENAEAALAAKDQVDRLQDMVEELGKMSNEELPKLVDKIRGSLGSEQATAYQQAASGILSELLSTVSEKKSALEQAVLVLTGDAQAEQGPKTDLELPDETGEDVVGDEGTDFEPSMDVEKKGPSPLGREPRLPAAESRKFNKALSEAKIVALKKALDETDTKKFPVRARRLAEELNRVATIAIKEEAKAKKATKEEEPVINMKAIKATDNAKPTSKGMMKSVAEAKKSAHEKISDMEFSKEKYKASKTGKKPAFLVKAEKKAEEKEGKKPQPKKK